MELIVNGKPRVSVDADELTVFGSDDDWHGNAASRSDGVLQGAVGGSARGPLSGSLQGKPDAFVVQLVAILLEGHLDPWIVSVELDVTGRDALVCAFHDSLALLVAVQQFTCS